LSERARVKPARVLARKDSSTRENRLLLHFSSVRLATAYFFLEILL
jgi:hypothetical protein